MGQQGKEKKKEGDVLGSENAKHPGGGGGGGGEKKNTQPRGRV